MKQIFLLLFLAIILVLCGTVVNAQQETCIYFFYGNGCPHCARVEPFLEELEQNPLMNVNIEQFEIYGNRSNAQLLDQFFDSYQIPGNSRGVPVVFIAHNYLVGDKPIIEQLEKLIEDYRGANCPKINGKETTGETGIYSPLEKLSTLSLFTIISAALVDSINPCAIAVLLILMSALILSGTKNRALKAGFAFTVSIYITYFLFGLGLFSALRITGLSYWFYKIVGLIAIVIGLANIKDYFWHGGGGFVMEIPMRWRPSLKKMLSGVTSPFGAFLAGFVVCFFELPCTGGPYIFILGLLAEKTARHIAIPLLLLYNLFFILPLIVLTLIIYSGYASVASANKWKDRNIKILHLITGIVMLALGLIVMLGLI